MSQFVASPGVEVIGHSIVTMAEAAGAFRRRVYDILKDCGIKDIDPKRWYRAQMWLDALKIIQNQVGDATLFNMGVEVSRTANVPPEVNSIEKVFSLFVVIYEMHHRGNQPKSWDIQKLGERMFRMTNWNPYPHEFNRGITWGFADRFKPRASVVSVVMEEWDNERADFLVSW